MTGLTTVFLFAPIAVVVVYSFNSVKSLATLQGFSTKWYGVLARDSGALGSVRVSLEIALATTLVATTIGVLLAIGLTRARPALSKATEATMLLNLVSPEIATAVALLLLFTGIGLQLGTATIALGHITFSIAYVTVIVRARLLGIGRELEEGAMDLGATELQGLRLVVLPLLWPAIVGAAMLVFLLSFDDFVTSFFTSGVGTPPLPLLIYGMIRFGVTPEINAIGTLMMAVTIVLGFLGVGLIQFRGSGIGRRGR
ncbi:MAG: ABC transporter permease [Actinomycetota bacterium]|nr:ABC transporter permease [Actinomycetota bacterium]